MTILTVLLTALLVLDCCFLILLILVQLPKKEAGAGMAFGGAATDALFGAGSGNVLTKITKWIAGAFFFLALVLSIMKTRQAHSSAGSLQEELQKKGTPAASIPAAPTQTPA